MVRKPEYRILFIHDDEEEAELAADKLEGKTGSIEYDIASDVENIDFSAIDCIVSRYNLSETNGVELLEKVRSNHEDLPFILFTSNGSEEIASKAVTAGVTEYIKRNGEEEDFRRLSERIEECLEDVDSEIDRIKRLLEDIFEDSSEAVYFRDRNESYRYVNQEYAEIFGLEPEDIIGKTVYNNFEEERAREISNTDKKVLETGKEFRDEIIQNVKGEKLYFLKSKFPYRDENGNIQGIIGVARNIKKRKRDERRLKAIFHNTQELMDFIDTDRTILSVNNTVTDFLECSREDMEGEKLGAKEYFFTESRTRELFREALDNRIVNETVEVKDKDDETHIMEFWLMPITDEEGEVSSVLVELQDVTENRRTQRQLEAVFNSSYEMIVLADIDGEILRLNSAVEEFFGVDQKAIVGKDFDELESYIRNNTFDDEYADLIDESSLQQIIEKGFYRDTITIQKPGGQNAILDVSVTPVKNEDDKITSLLIEGRDITEMKSNERQLKDQNKRLEKFSSTVSHDLRNPLNIASGYLELARETGDKEDFERVRTAIDRMDDIIQELLVLSGTPEEFETEKLDLEDVFEKAYSFVNASPEYSIDGNIEFEGRGFGITRIFENMIRNTVQHNEDADIKLGALENGFYYEDTGEVEEDINKITEYGYTSSEDGNGIGLSVIQRISEINNWDLNAVKTDDGGLRLEFLID